MAAAVPSNPHTVLPDPQTAPPQRTSYLNRCVEALSPNTLATAQSNASYYKFKAIVTAIAFTALAIVAFVFASISFPTFIPVFGVTAFALANCVGQFVVQAAKSSLSADQEIEEYKKLKGHYDALQQTDSSNVSNPLRAKVKYLEEAIKECKAEKGKLLAEVQQLETATPPVNSYDVTCKKLEALFVEEKALHYKIQAAFVCAVIAKSDFQGTLKDVASPSWPSPLERVVGKALDEPRAQEFYTFQNSALSPITYEEAKTQDMATLTGRMVQAMPA